MHLRKIGIRGFRSIVKANLNLGQITVVIGPTDSGKSNVVRALEAWAFNESGGGFITVGRQQCRIAVAVGSDHLVMFEKSLRGKKGAGAYVVVDSRAGTTERFEKIGVTVPVEVSDLTGVADMVVDDLSVPLQFVPQDDDRFLLGPGWTPAKVSRIVGKISGVDALILAQRDLASEKTLKNREVKKATAEIAELDAKLEELAWVPDATRALKRASKQAKAVSRTSGEISEAERTIGRLRSLRQEQAAERSYHRSLVENVEALDAIPLARTASKLADVKALWSTLETLRSRKTGIEEKREKLATKIEADTQELESLAESGAVLCPLCGGPAHDGCIESLAERARGSNV